MGPAPDGADVDLRPGRQSAAYTDVSDWVGLSGVSPQAHSLYVKLRMHVNQKRGDTKVWPGTDTLAALMTRGRGDKIAPWLQELVDIGAIEIQRFGMPRRSIYIIHSLPADDYVGPTTIGQWYAIHRPLLAIAREAEKTKRDARRAKKRKRDAVDPISGEQASGTPVDPESGEQVDPESGEHVTPESGGEQGRRELDEVEQSPPPSPEPAAPDPVGVREEEPASPDVEELDLARDIMALVASDAPEEIRPRGWQVGKLTKAIAAKLVEGWPPNRLEDELGAGSFRGADSAYAVIDSRVKKLGPPPPPKPAAPPKPPTLAELAETCTTAGCDAGYVDVGSPGVLACPTCRPKAHAAQLAAVRTKDQRVGNFDELAAWLGRAAA